MRNFRKKIIPVVLFIFLVITIPLTVSLVQKRHEIRSRAEGTAPTTPKIAGLVLPSIQGFQSDAFTGSSSVSYPLSLPAGIGGLKPNLSLSYSSGGVDDMHVGTDNWQVKYPAQAGLPGLGWQLGGIDNITAGGDGRFFATVGGASYELINESYSTYDGHPESPNWHTNPESYIKIEHLITGGYGFNNINPWLITTKDGTKYTFGSTIEETYNDSPAIATAYEIQDKTDPTHPGEGTSAKVGYKWMVKKIEDTHNNTINFNYQTEIGTDIRGVVDGSGCEGNYSPPENHHYVRSIRPASMSWNNNHYTAEFVYEDRTDKNIDNPNPSCNNPQKHFTDKRIKGILIKVDGQLLRKYVLDYQYATHTPNHSLLTSITQKGTDGVTTLPPYTFSYYYHDTGFYGILSGNATYLQIANNGYNGRVSYEYRWGSIFMCNQNNQCTQAPSSANRVRVIRKTVEDGMLNSFVSSLSYSDDGGSSEGGFAFGDLVYPPPSVTPTPGSSPGLKNYEFLGHGWTKETLSEKNSPSQKVSITKSYFHQRDRVLKPTVTPTPGVVPPDDQWYYFPDPRKGRAATAEVLDPQDETRILSTSQSLYDYNPKPTFNPVDGKMDRNFHPFMALYHTYNVIDVPPSQKRTAAHYVYDSFGNQAVVTEDGDLDKTGDERQSETSYIYNPSKWIMNKPLLARQFRKPPGAASFIEFARTGYYYDEQGWSVPPIRGDVTTVDKVSLGPEVHLVTRTRYDITTGNPIEVTDAKGNRTTTRYDARFNLFPVEVINAKNQSTQTEYNYLLGAPSRVIDINGVETKFEYDALGRATKIIKVGDTPERPTVEYVFKDNVPAAGAPMAVGTKARIESGTSQIMESYQFYNGLGQLLQEQSYGPNTGQITISNTVYNSRGLVTEKPIPYYRDLPMGVYHSPAAALRTLTDYDALGRVIKVTNLDGTYATTAYNGFTKTVTNEANVRKVFENDVYGNLLKIQEFINPGGSAPVYATTYYEYDLALGVLTKVTDTKGNITTITYDNFGRKTDMNDPDLGHWKYEYDANGNLTKQTDAKNQAVTFEYDSLNRLTKKLYPDSSQNVTYQYDEYDPNPDHPQFGRGKRTGMFDHSGGAHTRYDNRGRVIEEFKTIVVDGQSNVFRTQYAYDALDRVKTIIYPDNEQVQYSYNRAGQPLGLSIIGGQQIVTDTTYNALSQVKKQDYGNNTSTEYKYYQGESGDPTSLRLKSISTTKVNPTPTPPTVLFSKTYSYDAVGNIARIAGPDETENFTYDYLNRLLSANTAYQASYTYDEIGNILTKAEGPDSRQLDYHPESSTSPWKPVHAPQRVTANGIPTQYIYDYNGNLVKDELRDIVYDYENRPKSITVLGEGVTPTPTVTPIPTTTPTPTITPPPTPTPTPTTSICQRLGEVSDCQTCINCRSENPQIVWCEDFMYTTNDYCAYTAENCQVNNGTVRTSCISPTPTPTLGPTLCDFDLDGTVSAHDIDLLKADYNPLQNVAKPTDVNNDGYVNALDYSICVRRVGM